MDAVAFAADDELRSNVEAQLRRQRDHDILLRTEALKRIRRILTPTIESHGYLGFAVIAPDGVQVAAGLDEAVGSKEISENHPSVLNSVTKVEPVLSLPIGSPLFPGHQSDRGSLVMVVAAPIRNEHGSTIASLAFRLNRTKTLRKPLGWGD